MLPQKRPLFNGSYFITVDFNWGVFHWEYVPRAGATHQTDGIAKVVIDCDTQEVKGVSLVMAMALRGVRNGRLSPSRL